MVAWAKSKRCLGDSTDNPNASADAEHRVGATPRIASALDEPPLQPSQSS